jgi:carboxymethylenebutenolidase
MCYDDNARPPIPPGEAQTVHTEELVLTAADGNRFAAFLARPEQRRRAQVLIYPDIRGLHQFYKELATRFAERGIMAISMDYFGRTAGLTGRDESFEFRPHVDQLKLSNILADAHAAISYLEAHGGAECDTFIVGFCIGGSLAIFTGTESWSLAGIIPFYSGFGRTLDPERGTALDVAGTVKVPVLGLYGGNDQGIPVEQVHAFDQALDQSGVEHDIVIYPGATHSFFDRRQTEFADASADAWQRILGFINAHSFV